MEGLVLSLEDVIAEVEMHCNNYFNEGNDIADAKREHPSAFLVLCGRIARYRRENPESAVVSESVVGLHSYTKATAVNGGTASWQNVFSADLAVWKRARFV